MSSVPPAPEPPPRPASRPVPEPPRPAVRRRARTPYRWLRRFLLLAGLSGVAGLAVMLFAYRFGNVETLEPTEERPSARIAGEEDVVTAGKNIDYVQNSGGEPVFRVQAKRSTQDKEGFARLEEVTLEVFREDGDVYTIVSDRARLNQDNGEAWLEGNVLVTGWSDLRLTSRAIEVKQNGRILVSPGTVEFRYPPDIVGRASRMTIDKVNDTVSLTEGVHIRSVGPADQALRLDAKRLVYKRGEGLIRAVEDVFLKRGGDELASHYLSLFLNPDGRTLKTLRARFKVRLHRRTYDAAGGEQTADIRAQLLEVVPNKANPEYRTVLLEGDKNAPARLDWVLADGVARTLKGRKMETKMEGNVPRRLSGFGNPMVMMEYLDMPGRDDYMLRRVCGASYTVSFLPDGQIQQMYLKGRVELQDHDAHVGGADEGTVDRVSGLMRLTGPMVNLYTAQGDIEAPDIQYNRSTGLIKARGGVQATLDAEAGVALEDTPLAAADGPVSVQAEEAHWTMVPAGFVFKGDVRAWRGQNLLLADQLRGDETGREMAAAGGVRTVWVPQRSSTAPSPTADPSLTTFTDGAPIEVDAATMAFRDAENVLVYTGDVKVVQQGRRLSCKELAIHMVPSSTNAEKMVCRDTVQFIDPVGGKKVEGDLAVFDVISETVEIFGEKVVLHETLDGNLLEGGYLYYEVETGETRLSARPPTPVKAGSE